jgi:hypothetical protein
MTPILPAEPASKREPIKTTIKAKKTNKCGTLTLSLKRVVCRVQVRYVVADASQSIDE